MPCQKRRAVAKQNKASKGVKKSRDSTRHWPSRSAKLHPTSGFGEPPKRSLDLSSNRGDRRHTPCRFCAVKTGLCHDVLDGGSDCWECNEGGSPCQELPTQARDTGRAITEAIARGASRLITRLLSQNLKALLDFLDDTDSELEEGGLEEQESEEEVGARSAREPRGYPEWYRKWAGTGAATYHESDDDDEPADSGRRKGGAQNADDAQNGRSAPNPRDDVTARRERIKKVLGELVDLLVR